MTKNWIAGVAVAAMSVTTALGSQSVQSMGKPSQSDAMAVSYTGCVESVNHGGTFVLTKVESVGAEAMRGEMPMKDDDHMMMKAIILSGSLKFSKHVGQKVSVTGSLSDGSMETMRENVSTLTVKGLKVIAKSCS